MIDNNQREHIAFRAREVGDVGLESLCDQAIAGYEDAAAEVADHAEYNADLVQWLAVGRVHGYRTRRNRGMEASSG